MKRLVAVVLAAVLTACAGSSPPAGDAAGPASPAGRATGRPTGAATASGTPGALQWTAPLVGGGELDGTSLAGGDVALWFWAPW